jgi:hypothetical protein
VKIFVVVFLKNRKAKSGTAQEPKIIKQENKAI